MLGETLFFPLRRVALKGKIGERQNGKGCIVFKRFIRDGSFARWRD